MQQLEDLDHAAQRSVAAEVESAVEGGACLIDDAGGRLGLKRSDITRWECRRSGLRRSKHKRFGQVNRFRSCKQFRLGPTPGLGQVNRIRLGPADAGQVTTVK